MMTAEQIKQKIKEAFQGVESEEFLQIKVNECLSGLKKSYENHKKEFPNITRTDWKNALETEAVKYQNTNAEIQKIGIYLLALDELEKEQK